MPNTYELSMRQAARAEDITSCYELANFMAQMGPESLGKTGVRVLLPLGLQSSL